MATNDNKLETGRLFALLGTQFMTAPKCDSSKQALSNSVYLSKWRRHAWSEK